MEVNYRVGNKKRNERHREFVFLWKVGRAAESNCRQRRKIREPDRTGMNQEAGRNAKCDAAENTSRKAGIIAENLSVRQDMQSEKMVRWSPGVLASEQIHYSITQLFHHLWTANAL